MIRHERPMFSDAYARATGRSAEDEDGAPTTDYVVWLESLIREARKLVRELKGGQGREYRAAADWFLRKTESL